MLETVKRYLSDLDNKSFSQHYVDYIVKVQDANLEAEVSTLLRHNTLNIYVMDKLLDKSFKGLIQ